MAVEQLKNHGSPAQEITVFKGLGQRDGGDAYLIIYISFDCSAAYWLVSSPCMQVLTSSISTEAPDSLTNFPLPLRFNIHLSLLSNFTRKFH